jgi:multidrug efflux system membrane fusion protein
MHKTKIRATFTWILRCATLLAIASAGACDHSEQARGASAAQERPPAPVMTVAALVRDVPVYIDEIGRCVSREMVTVQPQVDGRVEAAHFVEGAMVKKGDLLFSVDPRPFQADLDKANAALMQNRENLKLAKLEWDRVEKLQGTSAMAQVDIDQKQSAVAVAQAQVRAAEAAVETARLNLEYCSIKSQVDGRAGQRLVDPGNIVKQNETKLVVVQAMDPIYADFTVPENDFGTARKYIAEGLIERPTFGDAKVSTNPLRVEVEVPADSSKVMAALGVSPTNPTTEPTTRPSVREGVLTFLDNSVQDNTGTIKLRATVPNADRYFWPGQFVRVRVILTTKKNAVLVPSKAIQIGQQGSFVFLVKEVANNPQMTVAELRPVVEGQRQGDMVVIQSGVEGGEQVIVTGQGMIAPAAKVKVLNAPTTAPTKPQPATAPTQS